MISETIRKYMCKVKDQNSILAFNHKENTAAWKRGKRNGVVHAEGKAAQLTETDGWMDGRTDSFEFLSPRFCLHSTSFGQTRRI